MGKINLKYVHTFKDRHGRDRAYFRYRGDRWPLPSPESAEFGSEYRRLKETLTGASVSSESGQNSLGWLIRQYQASPEFAQLSLSTQAQYRRILSDIAQQHEKKSWRALNKAAVIKYFRDPFAPTTRKADTYVSTIAAIYRWAIIRGMITENPAHGIPKLYQLKQGHRA